MHDTTDPTETIPENAWFKSSYSGAGSGSDCVECAVLTGGVAIRDSKIPAGGVLRFPAVTMAAFLNSL